MKNINTKKILLIEIALAAAGLFSLIASTRPTPVAAFLDLPTLLTLLFFAVPPLIASGLWRDFLRAFFINPESNYSVSQLKRCLEAVSMMQRLLLAACFISALISSITVLCTLDDLSRLGPTVAVIILSGLYTVILEFILMPIRSAIQIAILNEMELDEDENTEEK